MKLIALFIGCCLIGNYSFTQYEGVEPIGVNPSLIKGKRVSENKSNTGTFDSTFVYRMDTIDFPVFDEFSTDKFQKYEANYTDPGVIDTLFYHLLDMSDVPVPNDQYYTQQQTFKRTVNLSAGEVTDENFSSIQVQIGDLSEYPVTYVPTDVYPPFYIYDTLDYPNPTDTVWITSPDIYQDSAHLFFTTLNDADAIWMDSEAYHNYTLAIDPWSLGVASFDGLDDTGYPYAIGSNTSNYADHLTSKPIDMSSVSPADSVYISFLYQKGGLGDAPEEGDSLVLEFYAKDLDKWDWIWSTNGSASFVGESNFTLAHIKVDNPDYFKKGFQFRFKNYGGLAGSLDHFHLDYVNLRAPSMVQDTVIKDFAFVYPIRTLLETFTSIPWDHYVNNPLGKMASNVEVSVRNSDNTAENEQNGSTEIFYNSTLEGSFVLDENLLNNGDLNYSPWTTYYSYHDFSTGTRFDETKPGPIEEFDIVSKATHQNSSFTLNDSTYSKQVFENYYSYDDGSAEAAYWGGNVAQGKLAVKYSPYESDSVIGVKVHFLPTISDVSNELFQITLWGDAGGEPGNILYQDEIFAPRQPEYQYDRNIFTTYYFQDTVKVPVDGSFYIGWKQIDEKKIYVGLDRNAVNNDKIFYNINSGSGWNMSSVQGTLMIRPVFSTAYDATIGITELQASEDFVLFPNPTSDVFNVRGSTQIESIKVYNIQGNLVKEERSNRIDMANEPSGIYFVRVNDGGKTYKLVKK